MLSWQGCQRHVIQVTEDHPLFDLTGNEHCSAAILEQELVHIVEILSCDQIRISLCHLRHDPAIHNVAGPVPLVPPVDVEDARLEKLNGDASQAGFWTHLLQPCDVLEQLLSRLLHVVLISLNPFHPITFVETRGHRFDALLAKISLKSSHTIFLKLGDIVPTEMNASHILRLFINGNLIFSLYHEIVSFRGCYCVCPLLVIEWVVRVGRIWMLNRLLQLF